MGKLPPNPREARHVDHGKVATQSRRNRPPRSTATPGGRVLFGGCPSCQPCLPFPQGFALQRIYTANKSHDVALVCEDRDLVLVPEGYHPVAAAAGYDCYYLNAQAGPTRAWLVTDNPAHRWIKTRAARSG